MLYQIMCSERNRLEQEIHSLQLQLSQFPEGKLITTFETKDYPLDASFVKALIQTYFL